MSVTCELYYSFGAVLQSFNFNDLFYSIKRVYSCEQFIYPINLSIFEILNEEVYNASLFLEVQCNIIALLYSLLLRHLLYQQGE